MNISVFGLGFVGGTTANCMSEIGNNVYGLDINEEKFKSINKEVVTTKDCKLAIKNTDISFICVETPCNKSGNIDLTALKRVCKQIGGQLRNKDDHVVVIRSTVFPNSLEILKKILEKESGKTCGEGFHLATNPEFLREVHAKEDFMNPIFIIIGTSNNEVADEILDCYKNIDSSKFVIPINAAPIFKYICNAWHSCKVAFTNEVGDICNENNIDGDEIMRIFCTDKSLNISEKYHKIGKKYGGHCLPKDISVLQHNIKEKYYLINAISKSNDENKR